MVTTLYCVLCVVTYLQQVSFVLSAINLTYCWYLLGHSYYHITPPYPMATPVVGKGKAESELLRANINDQLNRCAIYYILYFLTSIISIHTLTPSLTLINTIDC
jgi:hypothetical protein